MAPVHNAARDNDVEALRALLDEDPGLIESEGTYKWRPLHRACHMGSVEAAELLMDRGADWRAKDDEYDTPFRAACACGRPEVVSLLLARGVDPRERDFYERETGLMKAAEGHGDEQSDHVAVIRLLLRDRRTPVNARDSRERTAVWRACAEGRAEAVRVLLMEGRAHYLSPDQDGVTPVAVARKRGDEAGRDCVRLLEGYNSDLQKPFLLLKARAVVDDTESITKAPQKAGAKTQAEAQRARQEAAPAYLRGRVERGEALPVLQVVNVGRRVRGQMEEDDGEMRAWLEYVLRWMKEDLFMELMEGLRYR